MNELIEKRVYMPIVRMQVFHTGPTTTFSIEFIGCTSDSSLKHCLFLSEGIIN